MTMGPAPMIRIEEISVLFGMAAPSDDRRFEIVRGYTREGPARKAVHARARGVFGRAVGASGGDIWVMKKRVDGGAARGIGVAARGPQSSGCAV